MSKSHHGLSHDENLLYIWCVWYPSYYEGTFGYIGQDGEYRGGLGHNVTKHSYQRPILMLLMMNSNNKDGKWSVFNHYGDNFIMFGKIVMEDAV